MSSFLALPVALVLLQTPLSVNAWYSSCSSDIYGNESCSNSSAIKYGVAIGIAVLFIFLIFFWMRARRNRMHASNLAYAQNQQTQMGRRPQQQQYGSSQPIYGQGPNGGYPSQSYGQNATGMYNANTDTYNGVQAPPPVYSGNNNPFTPPAGPPPNFTTTTHDSTLTAEERELQQHEDNLRRENGQEPAYYAPPPGGPPVAGAGK
ncbi:hypothetical protein BDY24DRAFT_399321 [Mrakia frigida]|uniref:uncharacterized protein n=1 Tax=Mrakia frigida TaxID=29902 RepID=UPI003FCC12FF